MEITGADNVSVSIHEEKLALKNVGDNGFLKRKEEFQACFAFPVRIQKDEIWLCSKIPIG